MIIPLRYSRLVLLVKQGVNIQIVEDLMDEVVSSIWLKVNKKEQRICTWQGYTGSTNTCSNLSKPNWWSSKPKPQMETLH